MLICFCSWHFFAKSPPVILYLAFSMTTQLLADTSSAESIKEVLAALVSKHEKTCSWCSLTSPVSFVTIPSTKVKLQETFEQRYCDVFFADIDCGRVDSFLQNNIVVKDASNAPKWDTVPFSKDEYELFIANTAKKGINFKFIVVVVIIIIVIVIVISIIIVVVVVKLKSNLSIQDTSLEIGTLALMGWICQIRNHSDGAFLH